MPPTEHTAVPRNPHREQWGAWKLIRSNFTLVHASPPFYEIDLDQMSTCGRMLDVIFQVTGKILMTDEDRSGLLEALRDVFNPQATLCTWGNTKELDAAQFLRSKYR